MPNPDETGVYNAEQTLRQLKIGVPNEKGQVMLIDGTIVETARPSWMTAARTGNMELLLTYLEERKDDPKGVNFTDPNGYTPFAIAVQYDQMDIAKMLLARGAKVNSQNKWMDTPLHRAGQAGYAEMTQFLLDNGADPMLEDWRNKRGYEYAKEELHRDVMKVFRLHKEANPDKYKHTMLRMMPKAEQPETVFEHKWEKEARERNKEYADKKWIEQIKKERAEGYTTSTDPDSYIDGIVPGHPELSRPKANAGIAG